jgi:D-sedoheptulose 7-phosphate isomerase
MRAFVEDYITSMADQLRAIDPAAVDRIGRRLLQTAEAGRQVLLAGNGGSASTASHFACDLAKTVLGATPNPKTHRFRAVSLADNSALLTAWANDASYDAVFAEQVRMLGRPGDLLCVISASGNSRNVVEAARAARALDMQTVAFLGCDGGQVKTLADDYLVVPCDDYGHVESAHLVLGHLLTDWLQEQLAERTSPDSSATGGDDYVESLEPLRGR